MAFRPTVQALIPQFLAERSHKITTAESRRSYRGKLTLLQEMFPGKRVDQFVESDLVQFCQAAPSPNAQLNRRSIVRAFFKWAQRAGLVEVDPAQHLTDVLDVKPRGVLAHRWLTSDQAAALVRAAEPGRDRIVLMLFVFTGLRIFEVTNLRWGHVDLHAGTLDVVAGKGGKTETIGLPGQLREELLAWRGECAKGLGRPVAPGDPVVVRRRWVFAQPGVAGTGELRTYWDRPLKENGIRAVVNATGEPAGLGHIDPHDLRRTFAGILKDSGVPIEDISQALRHENVGTTQRYLEKKPNLEVAKGFRLAL